MTPISSDSPTSTFAAAETTGKTSIKKESPRSIAALLAYIRRDADENTSHYLLRSNTSHDGE